MNYAPILIPTLCRYDHFKKCIQSLAANSLAKASDLYIALDYPLSDSQWAGYNAIDNYLNGLSGFKSIEIIKRKNNFGAILNIITAREEIFKLYDRIIISEDDNEFSPNFLEYLNKCLDKFEHDNSVLAVCGYSYPISFAHKNNNIVRIQTFFSAWGFGIWKNRYESIIIDKDKVNYLRQVLKNRNMISKIYKMAKKDYVYLVTSLGSHRNIGNDIFLSLFMIINGMYTINPLVSKVRNRGWDGSGIHCKMSNYDYGKQEIDDDHCFEITCDDDLAYFDENVEKLNQLYMPSKTEMIVAHCALLIFLSCGINVYNILTKVYKIYCRNYIKLTSSNIIN